MFSSPVGGSPRGNEPDQNNINKTVEVTRKSDAPKSSLPKESRLQNRWNESHADACSHPIRCSNTRGQYNEMA